MGWRRHGATARPDRAGGALASVRRVGGRAGSDGAAGGRCGTAATCGRGSAEQVVDAGGQGVGRLGVVQEPVTFGLPLEGDPAGPA